MRSFFDPALAVESLPFALPGLRYTVLIAVAFTIRNRFGEVLSYPEERHEPVLISKGKRVRAPLVPIDELELVVERPQNERAIRTDPTNGSIRSPSSL